MKIIIEIKDSATLERIAALGDRLRAELEFEFDDVIADISKEW